MIPKIAEKTFTISKLLQGLDQVVFIAGTVLAGKAMENSGVSIS